MQHLYGPYGTISEANTGRLAGSEANAAWFHGFNALLFNRAAHAGVAANVEFRTFRADFGEHPELVPTGVDGRPLRYGELVQGVCLSQTDFIAEREEALREGMRQFKPTGVWLDYLTYAGWFETPEPDLQESCFCAACVTEFNEATGVDCSDPREILERYDREWHEHKCERIEHYGRRFAAIIREARPETLVGLYACPWYPDEFDSALTRIFAQDFARLAPVFDVVTPLMYASKCGRPPGWSAEYLRRAPEFLAAGTTVAPIVDVLDFPANMQALADLAEGPDATAVPGVQVFAGDSVFADTRRMAQFDAAVRRMRKAQTGS